MPRLDLNLLPHLHALLDTRSVSRAADSVGIGQPAMSASLRKLRLHFGDALLVRSGRTSRLTPFALSLRPTVENALTLVQRASEAGSSFDPLVTQRTFAIGASDYVRALFTAPLMRLLAAEAPGAQLRLTAVPRGRQNDVRLHLADAVIAPEGYAIAGPHEHLFDDVFVVIADRRHPVMTDEAVRPDALVEYPQATVDFGVSAPSPSERTLDELGLQRRVQLTVPGLLDLPRSIVGTRLLAFVPGRVTTMPDFPAELAVLRFPREREPGLAEAVFWSPEAGSDPAHGWLRHLIVRAAGSLGPPVGDVGRRMVRG